MRQATYSLGNQVRVNKVFNRGFGFVAGLLLVLSPLAGIMFMPKAQAATAGDVVITEFMADPTAVLDNAGEWIEIKNATSSAIDMTGWDIDSHALSPAPVLGPGEYAVICKNANQATNGDVVCDSQSGFGLTNTGDTIALKDQTDTVIDTVTYTSSDVVAGHSTNVDNGSFSIENTEKYNDFDYGTPANNVKGQIRVHTILDNNADAWPFFGENHETGWTIRLYDTSWNPVNGGDGGTNEVVTTGLAYDQSAMFMVNPGDYYACEVLQPGYLQSLALTITSYVTFDDTSVLNQSGEIDEGKLCVSVPDMEYGKITSHVFGNNIGGEIRVHQVTDTNGDGWPNFLGIETHTAGWTIRLYRINHLDEWKLTGETVTTNLPYNAAAKFNVAAGDYVLCEVLQDGFVQSYGRNILGWYNIPPSEVTNISGASDEAEDCITLSLSSNQISGHIFGNIPEEDEGETGGTGGGSGSSQTPSQTSNDNNGAVEPVDGVVANFANVTPPAAGVLGTNTDNQQGEDNDADTDVLSDFTDNTSPQVLSAQDTSGTSWTNWLKWLLPLFLLALLLIFLLARRRDDEEETT